MRTMKDLLKDILESEIFPRVLALIKAEKGANVDDEIVDPFEYDQQMRENTQRLLALYIPSDAPDQMVPSTLQEQERQGDD